ncbi:MAG: hypothetical protein ACOWWO_08705 [Peptococcaceae bacterium]
MENEKFQNLVLEHMARLTQEITEIKGEINGVKGEINGVKGEINGIKGEINGIKGEINGIKGEIKKINLKLENEIEPKIAALFEGQQIHSAQLNRIEEKLGQHEEFIIKRIK